MDHLHTRGEYCSFWAFEATAEGSPPHTWRIHDILQKAVKEIRITSTHVENTHSTAGWFGDNGDHLHTRGEYKILRLQWILQAGSPPHTWRILQLSL